jgi:hypothetical protein
MTGDRKAANVQNDSPRVFPRPVKPRTSARLQIMSLISITWHWVRALGTYPIRVPFPEIPLPVRERGKKGSGLKHANTACQDEAGQFRFRGATGGFESDFLADKNGIIVRFIAT